MTSSINKQADRDANDFTIISTTGSVAFEAGTYSEVDRTYDSVTVFSQLCFVITQLKYYDIA